MTKKKKEQLEEVVEESPKEEVPVEETKKPAEEKPAEEVVEESTEEEKPAEEEPTKEKIEKVDNLDVEDEQLTKEIKETKEELYVIKEVREELIKLYGDFKESEQLKNDAETKNEQLVTKNEQLAKDIEMLSAKLNDYKVAEEKLEAEQKLQRLEQLSVKFSALGQQKSVEYLSGKDIDTISEFEKIVDAALVKVGDTTEMPSVTDNTQAEKLDEKATSEEEKPSEKAPEVPKEQLSNEEFFRGVCNTLTEQQHAESVNKRGKLM